MVKQPSNRTSGRLLARVTRRCVPPTEGATAPRWPDFFIVGAPRCGTTAMYEFLGEHPRVFMPSAKEPHFFGSDLPSLPHFVRDRPRYLRLFAGARTAQRVGEASVWYLASCRAAAEIKASVPRARIIVQLRDPVEVMYSLHGLRVLLGQEELVDFEAALAAEPARAAGRRPWPSGLPLYRETVRFTDQVGRYLVAFGREAIHVILYDDLCRDVAAVYRGTLAFLGVEPDHQARFRIVNAGHPPRSVALAGLPTRLPRLTALLRRVVPLRSRVRLRGWVSGLNTRPEARPPLAADVRRRLGVELRPEVERLGELLGRDLRHWSRA